MPRLSPITPIRFAQPPQGPPDLSTKIAPPYDVLDKAGKDKLLSGNDRNIVAIDLPHTPAKELGPPEAYASAGESLCGWLDSGDLTKREVVGRRGGDGDGVRGDQEIASGRRSCIR